MPPGGLVARASRQKAKSGGNRGHTAAGSRSSRLGTLHVEHDGCVRDCCGAPKTGHHNVKNPRNGCDLHFVTGDYDARECFRQTTSGGSAVAAWPTATRPRRTARFGVPNPRCAEAAIGMVTGVRRMEPRALSSRHYLGYIGSCRQADRTGSHALKRRTKTKSRLRA